MSARHEHARTMKEHAENAADHAESAAMMVYNGGGETFRDLAFQEFCFSNIALAKALAILADSEGL